MLTAQAELGDKLSALGIGVDDYMLKPFNEEELLARVGRLINNLLNRREAQKSELLKKNPEIEESYLSQNDLEGLISSSVSNFNFKVNGLTKSLLISCPKLSKQVKSLTGLTVNEYIKEVSLQKAKVLLENKKFHSVKELAFRVGGKHSNYFLKRFGRRPSQDFKSNNYGNKK